MNRIPLLCLTVSLLMTSSALSQNVDCEFRDAADFSHFKTYKWIAFTNVAPIDKLTDEQIKAAVDAALAKKGLTKVDVDTADLFIGYQSRERDTEEVWVWGEPPKPINKGELAIDMYTPANHKLVWRAVASVVSHK